MRGIAAAPYEALAGRYDAVMAHVDYPGWAELVRRVWSLHGVDPRRILETGSGTCRLASFLADRRRRIVASDLCLPMLRQGAARNRERVCCDFRALPFPDGSFDAVLCLYDAINYCQSRADLDAFFTEARRVLRSGGILMADATTVRNSRRHFADTVFHEVHRDVEVVRHSWFESGARAQHNDFTFFTPRGDGAFDRSEEHHVQIVWSRREFREASSRAGFSPLSFHDEALLPAGPDALRLHMVARAP